MTLSDLNGRPAAHLSVLEKLQQTNPSAEIWWDSSPLDFPLWRAKMLGSAPHPATRRRWAEQLDRFLTPEQPEHSLVRGITTNPSLLAKSILAAPEVWSREVGRRAASRRTSDVDTVFREVYQEAGRRAAEAMASMWQRTGGRYGWVSVQLDPRHMFDAIRMLDDAVRIAELGPNVMVKVPGTAAGYEVIRELVGRGVSINNTLAYTVPQFLACVRAVRDGLARARRQGIDTTRWRAVVTHMIGRFGSNGDLLDQAAVRGITLSEVEVRWAEVAVLKRIHEIIQRDGHPVKMLLSSLEVDQRTASLSTHLQQTAGADIAYTCKPDFVEAVMRREAELERFDPAAIACAPPEAVLDKLMCLPYFRAAIEPDGLRPDEFANHGAFLTTYAEVNWHTRRLIDFVAHQIERLPGVPSRPAFAHA